MIQGANPPLRVGANPPLRVGANPPLRVGANPPLRVGAAAARGLVVLLVVLAGAPFCFGETPDDLLGVGKKAFGDGQYPLAISSFQRIQDEYPESPRSEEAGYLLGVSLFYAGRWSDSLSEFSLLLIRNPKSSLNLRAAYWVGAANLRLGNWQAALDSLSAFLGGPAGASPYRLSALFDQAIAMEGLGRDAEAGASYRALLQDPSAAAYKAEATFRLAGTEFRAGRYAVARDLYGTVLLDNTSSAFVRDAVYFAGECELALDMLAEAEKRFRTVLAIYPDSPYLEAASFRLVDIAWRQKRASALRQVGDFLARFPGGAHSGSALRLRGDITLAQKAPADALSAYQQAVAILPEGPEKQSAYYSMAMAQLALGRKLEAVDSLERAGPAARAALTKSRRRPGSSAPCFLPGKAGSRRPSKPCGNSSGHFHEVLAPRKPADCLARSWKNRGTRRPPARCGTSLPSGSPGPGFCPNTSIPGAGACWPSAAGPRPWTISSAL